MLNKIFNSKTIALIGATDRSGSVGLGISKNLLAGRSLRKIFFVNPNKAKVLGHKTYDSVLEIKEKVDLAIIAVPAKVVPLVVRQAVEKQVGSLIVISAGFAETGKKGKMLQEQIAKLAKETQTPLLGPNCLGIISPRLKLNASFAPAMPRAGSIAFISQSGALIDSMIDRSLKENYGFSTIVSYGNEAGVELCDILDWLKSDSETKVVALYLEGVKQGSNFIKSATQLAKIKPVFVLKAGKSEAGKKAALSHTAFLSSPSEIYSAVFKQTGLVEVETLTELFNNSKAMAWQPRCKNGIGIVTNGGGVGVLMVDYCQNMGIKLSKLEPKTIRLLEKSKVMHQGYSKRNPLDIVGDALSERYLVAIESLLSQDNISGIIVAQTFQIMTEVEKNAKIMLRAKKKYPKKPIIACFMGGKFTQSGIDLLEKGRIPNYFDPKHAVSAMRALIK